jgi:hypothetical protein
MLSVYKRVEGSSMKVHGGKMRMATAKEPSEAEQFRRLIVEQHLCGPMDSLSRAQLALGCSIPTEIQKLFSEQEIDYVIKTVARAIDEAVAAASPAE